MAFDADNYVPPEREWLLLTGQTGLVFAPRVMSAHQLIPERQTALDSAAIEALVDKDDSRPAIPDPWTFAETVLGWPASRVFGAPGGPPLPAEVTVALPEHHTILEPTWAVKDRAEAWQLLVRIEAPGVDPDARGALAGWEATPHQRFERLLRETGVGAGVLITDREIRLVYAPKGETSGWIVWRPRDLVTTAGRPMLGGLKLVLGRHRMFAAPKDETLRALLDEFRKAQEAVSTQLAGQVLGALHELVRGYVAAEPERARALAQEDPHHLYEGLLTVLLRLVFILYAEDRDLLPSSTDGEARTFYEQNYSVRGLLERLDDDAALYPDTMDERKGAWGQLLALFRLIHGGHGDWIAPRGGKLFDPDTFLFLEGRIEKTDKPRVAGLSDGHLYRILSGLMRLDGERLSYRTLDVEQIGSVYETVMGFTVKPAAGLSLAIRAGKNNRTPVFVDLDALTKATGDARIKGLKEEYGRSLTDAQARAVKAARTVDEMAAALSSIVDERGSPGGVRFEPGVPVLQPTDERRRTGSHYTPRALTEPIVRHALEPAFARLGPQAKPEDVLALKVCDPAMGSGAFLVEACRQVGARLEQAYLQHGVPADIPKDEDLSLYAKRRVAQVCIYGVDKNPMATDLARLSMWLLTLAKDHEFAFLDHALKTGDSLVGLTLKQIEAANWDESKPGHEILRTIVRGKVKEALQAREAVRNAPEQDRVFEQVLRNRAAEAAAATVRTIGDAVIAAFFAGSKKKVREDERIKVEQAAASSDSARWDWLRARGAELGKGERGLRPFHWELEFPEVFRADEPGFDACVGNPPFLGGSRISSEFGDEYLSWLFTIHHGSHGLADLVSHFFRRAYLLVRPYGCIGLIATNTIAQGDTRSSGLRVILQEGGAVSRAIRRLRWPGEAAVVVAVVHITKGHIQQALLNGARVRRVSAYLIPGMFDDDPTPLCENLGKSFVGTKIYGQGFLFDSEDPRANSEADFENLQNEFPEEIRVVRPYIGGEEVNTSPTHASRRTVIDLGSIPLNIAEARYPGVIKLLRSKVKPGRDKNKRGARKERWWLFGDRQPGLYRALTGKEFALVVNAGAAPHFGVAMVPADQVFSHSLAVLTLEGFRAFGVVQSRCHESWSRVFASSMKDDLRYTPSDCFRTFPFPGTQYDGLQLENAGEAYHDYRAELMVERNEGLTKTYNRFHDRDETSSDIQRLRELHADMDRAVLLAYADGETDEAKAAFWRDLAKRAKPEFIEQEADEGKRAKTRLDWPQAFKDEVLGVLLELNAARAAEERKLGLTPAVEDEDEDVEAVEA